MGGMGTADGASARSAMTERAPRPTWARPRRPGLALAAAATLAACLLMALPAAAAAEGAKGAKHGRGCPRQAAKALPLGKGAIEQARGAALAAAPRLYRGLDVSGAKVLWAKPADAAGPRGGEVAYQCGKTVQARTVVVELRFPRELPSTSLSQGVVFVSRFKRGYAVWEVAH